MSNVDKEWNEVVKYLDAEAKALKEAKEKRRGEIIGHITVALIVIVLVSLFSCPFLFYDVISSILIDILIFFALLFFLVCFAPMIFLYIIFSELEKGLAKRK